MKLPLIYHDGKRIDDLRTAIRAAARRYSARPALMQKSGGSYGEISYAELLYRVEGLGTELLTRGFYGKRVILMGDNSIGWATVFLAAVCGLAIPVTVDRDISEQNLLKIVEKTGASAIFYSSRLKDKLSSLPESLERISFSETDEIFEAGSLNLASGNTDYLRLSVEPDDLAVISFTVSSSGEPRGIMLSHKNICSDLSALTRTLICYPEDVFLSVLPMHHTLEMTVGFLYPLISGASIGFCEGLRYLSGNLGEVRPTVMVCVPYLIETMYRKINNNIRIKGKEKSVKVSRKLTGSSISLKKRIFKEIHDSFGGRLRLLISGGAQTDPETVRGMREFGFRTAQSYGLSDCLPLIAVSSDFAFKNASVGVCVPDGVLDIYNIGSDGIGEIRYKGENIMSGLLGEPAKTASMKKDGWLYTGDLGYIDRDGFLYITGKKKNAILTASGKSVFPEELESLLRKNSFISEAIVVGYANEIRENYDVVAVLLPDQSRFEEVYGKGFTRGQVDAEFMRAIAEVNAQVDSHKRINFFVTRRTPFNTTPSRKISRAVVAQEARADYLRKLART